MTNLYNLVRTWLWMAGGISAALELGLDLGLDALGSAGYVPCPSKAAPTRAGTLKPGVLE